MPRPKSKLAEDPDPPRDLPPYSVAIANARDARGWTQAALGSKVGRSQQAVTSWETGTKAVPPELWAKLCDLLDLSPELFFQGKSGVSADGQGFESLIERQRRRLFAQLHNGLLTSAREIGIAITAPDLAYILHNTWTRALLLDEPPTLEERIDVLLRRQREIWQRGRDQ